MENILNFDEYIIESNSLFLLDPETKSKLLVLDEKYHKLIEKFRTKYVAQTVKNIKEEYDKFMAAHNLGQTYYPQLEIENSEVDMKIYDDMGKLKEEFEKIKDKCYVAKFYIEKLHSMRLSLEQRKKLEDGSYEPGDNPVDKEFIALFKRAIPILISASITQINIVVLNFFANSFDKGSIYGYRNASTIWQIPYSVFVVAITTVMTPQLAGDYGANKLDECSRLLSKSMKNALFLSIPSAAFIAVMNLDVVKAIYQWSSRYTDKNANTAAIFLLGFSSAIITAAVIHVFNQAFYAIGQTRIPLFAGIVGLVLNPVFCILFIELGMGPLSLSFAYSATNFCQMILLSVLYCKRKELAPHGIVGFLVKSFAAAAVMAVVCFVFDRIVPGQGRKIQQLLIFGVKGITAVIIYFLIAILLKMEEANFWIKKIKGRVGRGSKK